MALGRLEKIYSGETLSAEKGGGTQIKAPEPPEPVYGVAIGVKDRKDEVKLTGALARLMEEDPSLRLEHAKDTHQMVLWGQGEMHLRVALERLKRKYGVEAELASRASCPTRRRSARASRSAAGTRSSRAGTASSATWCSTSSRCRAARASSSTRRSPAAWCRGSSFPSVEIGVSDYLQHGPLGGFPVVDVAVTLTDGSYHSVDSSDMAFRQAGRIGMAEGMPKCSPVLLEPIMEVEIAIPTDATARVNGMIPQRRGQILGFDAREGWPGWDVVRAQLPESEMADLIVELRSATAGVGTFTAKFHHLAELTGRLADNVLAAHKAAAE